MKYTSGKVENCQLFNALCEAACFSRSSVRLEIAKSFQRITRKHLF
jgi:hypothetical protein